MRFGRCACRNECVRLGTRAVCKHASAPRGSESRRPLASCPIADLSSERMFDSRTLVSTRETAAVLALIARRGIPWKQIAGAIEEKGSALGLLEELDAVTPTQLFRVEDDEVTLDQLEEYVHAWERERIGLVT